MQCASNVEVVVRSVTSRGREACSGEDEEDISLHQARSAHRRAKTAPKRVFRVTGARTLHNLSCMHPLCLRP